MINVKSVQHPNCWVLGCVIHPGIKFLIKKMLIIINFKRLENLNSRAVVHYIQEHNSKNFCAYDYGLDGNLVIPETLNFKSHV